MIRKILIYPAIFIFAVLGILTAYYFSGDETTHQPDIQIHNIVLRLPAPGQSTAAAYFDVINKGGADELLSARSAVSPRVELHTHLHEDGVMKMRQVKTVKIQGLQTTSFKPGGLHVMLFDFSTPPKTQAIPITLTFARSGEKQILAIIGTPTPDHSKMGH